MATLEQNFQRYIKAIRLFLNDNATLNRLIRREESDDDHIRLAIIMALSEYDATDPVKHGYSVTSFPNVSMLINGAIVQILKMVGLLHARNKLSYSAGGLSINLFDKDGDYMRWIQMFLRDFETKSQKLQIQQNISEALDDCPAGNHSQYVLAAFDVLPD